MRRTSVFTAGENLGAGAALPTPSISITEGWRPPLAAETQKERHLLSADVFLFGKALQSRYFKFSIRHLDILPNGPSGPRRFCGVRGFAAGKTSAEGWLCHPEHLNHRRAERALGPRSPKRKTRYKRVFLFGGGGESRTPVRKPFHGNFSGRRRLLRESCSPCSRHLRQAVTPEGQVSFMIHGRRKALPAHVHH